MDVWFKIGGQTGKNQELFPVVVIAPSVVDGGIERSSMTATKGFAPLNFIRSSQSYRGFLDRSTNSTPGKGSMLGQTKRLPCNSKVLAFIRI